MTFARITSCFLLAGALGCVAEAPTTPSDQSTAAQSGPGSDLATMSLSQATSEISQTGLRIEVTVRPGTPLVATEVAIDAPDLAKQPEQVQANVTAVDPTAGTITTDLGNLAVGFDGNTTFTKDEGGTSLTTDQLVAAINDALAGGKHPHVTARRAAPASPQAPGDGTFLADQIRLGGTSDTHKLDLNVGRGSLELNTTPPPDAFLKLLGLTIEIRVSDGTTHLGHRMERTGRPVEFAGLVTSVRPERHAVVLSSGVVIVLTDKTVIEGDQLKTLDDVSRALNAGLMVGAEGSGMLSTVEPRVITADKVEFEARPRVVEFREGVKSADATSGKLTLTNGAVLCLNDHSVIDPEGDFASLADVATALAAGKSVGAAGTATPTPDGNGCRAQVLKVRFTLRPPPPPPPPPMAEFHDVVKSVDVSARTITLGIGATLCLDDHSIINPEGSFATLADVAAALTAGKVVGALGVAALGVTTGCRATIIKVTFIAPPPPPPPPVVEFHEGVKSVDVDGRKLTLSNDVSLCLDEHSVISQDTDLKSLADVSAALIGGKRVRADGAATPLGVDGCRALVVKVKFSFAT